MSGNLRPVKREDNLQGDGWVQMWVQVTSLWESLDAVSSAGSTKALTATNQDVAGGRETTGACRRNCDGRVCIRPDAI